MKGRQDGLKYCSGCKRLLPISNFTNNITKVDGLENWCKSCRAKKAEKYSQTKQGQETNKKACKKYYNTDYGYIAHKRKQTKRKRHMNWILMFPNPFADSVPVDYHHINNAYVVAIPRDLHQLYGGKYHREKVMEIVKQIYLK